MERKDPVTGVWVIHPAQYWHDNQDAMMRMIDETEQENRRRETELKGDKKLAQEFLDGVVLDEHRIHIGTVLDANISEGPAGGREEIIFKEAYGGKKYAAGCEFSSGSFYEPPDGECWIEPIDELMKLNYLPKERKHYLEKFL